MKDNSATIGTTLCGDGIASRSFRTPSGGGEHYLSIKAPEILDFKEQVKFLQKQYSKAQKTLGIAPTTAIFRRIFLSDILNQATFVKQSDLVDDTTAISIVQQSPLPRSKIEMLAYHVDSLDPVKKRRLSPRHLIVEKNKRRHIWSTQLCTDDQETSHSSGAQTRGVFNNLIDILNNQGATLRDNCVRTWIYVKGVDLFYKGMVDSRRELFSEQGMSSSTHYIASTGIEGACSHRFDLVAMDAYSNLDLVQGQMSHLNEFERLCPTKDYNVTFERGTRIAYADRAHCFISGTASIDKYGDVLHLGDVMRQLERSLDNVDALLRSGSATLADMMYLIVYLRDPADFTQVDTYLHTRFPFLPLIIVQGAVCRPEWLVEVEGVAITKNQETTISSF